MMAIDCVPRCLGRHTYEGDPCLSQQQGCGSPSGIAVNMGRAMKEAQLFGTARKAEPAAVGYCLLFYFGFLISTLCIVGGLLTL